MNTHFEQRVLEEAHAKLVSLIIKKGETFRKKHGNWIRIKLYDDLWLTLDTWNKAILLVKGKCTYDNMCSGFTDYEEREYIGINFGRFESHVSAHRMRYLYELARIHNL